MMVEQFAHKAELVVDIDDGAQVVNLLGIHTRLQLLLDITATLIQGVGQCAPGGAVEAFILEIVKQRRLLLFLAERFLSGLRLFGEELVIAVALNLLHHGLHHRGRLLSRWFRGKDGF